MQWRVIENDMFEPAMNMAIDQSVYEQVALKNAEPTIRFYQWDRPTFSLGSHQMIRDINGEYCKNHRIALVRRMTGGGGIIHSLHDVSVSVFVPVSWYNYSIQTIKRSLSNSVLIALKKLGIKGEITSSHKVTVKGNALMDFAAKAMENGIYVYQMTLFVKREHTLGDFLDSSVRLVDDKTTQVSLLTTKDQSAILKSIREGFTKEKNTTGGQLSPKERARAVELVESRYSSLHYPKQPPSSHSFMDDFEIE